MRTNPQTVNRGSSRNVLGPARRRLFSRLRKELPEIATPKVADEFTQMSVPDCRRFVRAWEHAKHHRPA